MFLTYEDDDFNKKCLFWHIIKNGRGAFLNQSLQVAKIVLVYCYDLYSEHPSAKIAPTLNSNLVKTVPVQ